MVDMRAAVRLTIHMTTDRYGRNQPTTEGTWVKAGKKRYQHIDGAVVAYDCNRFVWVIEGTRLAFRTLWAAQMHAEQATA